MGRIKNGWRLAKQSWAVLRADRSLAVFPVIFRVALYGFATEGGGMAGFEQGDLAAAFGPKRRRH